MKLFSPHNNVDSEDKTSYLGIRYYNEKSILFKNRLLKSVAKLIPEQTKFNTYFPIIVPCYISFQNRLKLDQIICHVFIRFLAKIVKRCILDKRKRPLKIRMREHQLCLKRPGISAAADHQLITGHNVDFSNVKVLRYEKLLSKRLILESLYIKNCKTFDNNTVSRSLLIFG